MKHIITALSLCSLLTLAGCSTPPTNQEVGTVGGAVVGGLVGSTIGGGTGRTVATIGGAAVGALVGNQIGKNMDEPHTDYYYYDDH